MSFWNVLVIYLIIGILFLFVIRKRLTNNISRDLSLYLWPPKVKSFYAIYIRNAVFIFWPLFLVALIVDLIIEYFDREEKMNTPIKMNFANTATPLRITNSLDDTIIVTVDPDTQQFNISKEGSPIINIGG